MEGLLTVPRRVLLLLMIKSRLLNRISVKFFSWHVRSDRANSIVLLLKFSIDSRASSCDGAGSLSKGEVGVTVTINNRRGLLLLSSPGLSEVDSGDVFPELSIFELEFSDSYHSFSLFGIQFLFLLVNQTSG